MVLNCFIAMKPMLSDHRVQNIDNRLEVILICPRWNYICYFWSVQSDHRSILKWQLCFLYDGRLMTTIICREVALQTLP